jgi:hypothetical protein
MSKKCIICSKEAEFVIKGSNDNYCEECAIENFGDLSLLLRVEEQALALKNIVTQADEHED